MIGVRPPQYDPAAPRQSTTLPVGSPATVRGYVRELAGRHRGAFALLVAVNTVAIVASMVGTVSAGRSGAGPVHRRTRHPSRPYRRAVPVSLAVQAYFVRLVRLRGAILGERMLADLREDFLVRAVALPPGVLERAGTGDLLSRITTDVDRLSNAMREAVPELAIAVVWALLLIGALAVTSPPLALSVLVALPLLVAGCRWYFRRAPACVPCRRRPDTRPSPPRSPSRWTPAAPSRRTAWATRREELIRAADRAVGGVGALHAVAAHRVLFPVDQPDARADPGVRADDRRHLRAARLGDRRAS